MVVKCISVLYIILFVYAATSKFLDFNTFKIQLNRFPFISSYAHWIVWFIPLLELFIAGLFLFPRFMLIAFYSSFALMTLFTTYILFVLNFSNTIPCSCGGVLRKLGWKDHVVFNITFMVLALIGIFIMHNPKNNQVLR